MNSGVPYDRLQTGLSGTLILDATAVESCVEEIALSNQVKRIDIVGADRLSGGLLIHFSNNTSTLFHSQSLYDVRDQDHNMPVLEEDDEVSGS